MTGEPSRLLLVRMLASRHWTGDVMIKSTPMLTVLGGAFIVMHSWLAGVALLLGAAVLGAGLCWLYLRAEAAGHAHDPIEHGEPPVRWRDLRPAEMAFGIVLTGVLIGIAIWLKWWPTTEGFLGG